MVEPLRQGADGGGGVVGGEIKEKEGAFDSILICVLWWMKLKWESMMIYWQCYRET